MKKIILTTFLIFSSAIVAHDLPNIFEAGEPIVASEVNENFTDLHNRLEELEELEDLNQSRPEDIELIGFATVENYLSFHSKIIACPQTYTNSYPCRIDDFENLNFDQETKYENSNGDTNFEAHFWWDKSEQDLFCQNVGYGGDAGSISINDGKIYKIETLPNNNSNCRNQLLACCK